MIRDFDIPLEQKMKQYFLNRRHTMECIKAEFEYTVRNLDRIFKNQGRMDAYLFMIRVCEEEIAEMSRLIKETPTALEG